MKNENKIEIIWDGAGWYFRSGNHEGVAPGQMALTDSDATRQTLISEAHEWARWEGVEIDNFTTFEVFE